MNNLEHGWLVGSDYHVIEGDRICCKCYDKRQNKLMEEEMYEE